MKGAFLLLTAVNLFGQGSLLSPNAVFDLDAARKPQHKQFNRPFFAATPSGLTFVSIGQNFVSFNSTDLNGQPLYSTTGLASEHASIYAALVRQDGDVWIISSGPASFSGLSATSGLGNAAPDSRSTGQLFQQPRR